ncbi:unnamed protein product [Rotaria socialis]|uniref:Uncharacterized protein n=1 Tax=Rotaria socialis TaxID=392032 RepID=A0A817X6Y0_9BILA|nr:unnamed protein product [Rotaria socialis]CAF4533496.1 unnamed protein product [Rotaria socialis]
MYDRNSVTSSNNCRIFDTGKNLLNFDCHSIVLNDPETHLLLVGNHELAFINFETLISQLDDLAGINTNGSLPSLFDVKLVSLFDSYNVNRPIVEWNCCEPNQYAVAIDRLVRFYTVDQANINESIAVIDSQHKRPISTISYAPHNTHWLLTGSLDGQIQVWDTRQCSVKNPASLKFTATTPFSIRRIQWSSEKTESSDQLAVQCDRSVRIYDIRRTDASVISSTDLEHTQRIIDMDWIKQSQSIVTLSSDQSIRIFSTTGQKIAESLPNEQSPCTFSKIQTTMYDNLLVCASRDPISSTSGFLGWHWDGEQCLQPLTNRILSPTLAPIVDFCFVKNTHFFNLFNNSSSSHMNDELTNRFLLLTWCRDGNLCLVEMDSTFRQTCMNQQTRTKLVNTADSGTTIDNSRTSIHPSRHHGTARNSLSTVTMDSIQSETSDTGDDDSDNPFQAMPASPPNTVESSEASDENDYPTIADKSNNAITEVSIQNELNSIHDSYGPYIFVETTDEQRRMCILRCIYSLDNSSSFRVFLTFSRHYPIISQLFVRFKLPTKNNDERLKSFQSHIQIMVEDTCYTCFYHGQLCLHRCLIKLKSLFDKYFKQARLFSTAQSMPNNTHKKRNQSSTNFDGDSINDFTKSNNNSTANNDNNSNRIFIPASSTTHTNESQISVNSFVHGHRRTCGARFSGSSHLICFGQVVSIQQTSSAPILTSLSDGTLNRPQSLPLRPTSLAVAKTRENSSTDEQSSYRTTAITNAMQIQYTQNNQRLPIFSAPVRPTFGTNIFDDDRRLSTGYQRSSTRCQRSSTGYQRSLGQTLRPHSTVSIYDVSILLPVSKKLADDYKIDLNNPVEMCEVNQEVAQKMGKTDLSHCWRLLGRLLSLQPNLQNDDSWFQTPIAQGLINHIVAAYVKNGDIQSASMFLLTMSQTSYLKTRIHTKLVAEHNSNPILYAYASLLHRWKHFYKRTQILSQIDHNCQSPAPFTPIASAQTTIMCSICLQPVLGQYFLCAICGHGGHLMHMHDWFSSDGLKHRYCPEKDCSCRCIIKQQELLAINTIQLQQQQPLPITPRPYLARQPSSSFRP